MLSAAVELAMADEERSQDNSSWFDKLVPKEKLSPAEKSALADKLLTRFYFCFAIASYLPYMAIRFDHESISPKLLSLLESLLVMWTVIPVVMLSILVGVIAGSMYEIKAYGWSPFAGIYSLGDIKLRHLKPLLIVPIYALITEVFVRIYF